MSKQIGKCIILPSDSIFFGSGGSNTIIVLTQDKHAYKFFPIFKWKTSKNKDIDLVDQKNNINNEINIGKYLSKYIVDRGISPHFVKFYGYNNCTNITKLFSKCPKYVDFMLEKKKDPICRNLYKNYPITEYEKDFTVLSMEYCDYSCSQFIKEISSMNILQIKYYLDIFFFQIFYTLLATKKIYPFFYHRDFFMRNILGIRKDKTSRYYRYNYNNKIYDVPVDMYMCKITDYGMSNLNEKYNDCKLLDDNNADFFNILYDVYNGNNLGSNSLTNLLKKKKLKIKFVKKYFNTFFNVEHIEKLKKLDISNMNWNWTNTFDKDFISYIEFKKPEKIMLNYFVKIFEYNSEHEIEQEFNS